MVEDDETHNGNTVVVDMCSLMELLLDLGVLLLRPSGRESQCRSVRMVVCSTYSTPPGWRAVLLTLIATALFREVE